MANWYVWSRVAVVAVCGFFYGYDNGFMNGVKNMRGYREALNLSYVLPSENSSESCDSQDDVETGAILGLIISLLFVGGLVGSLIAGPISDFLGRKPAILIGASLISLGGLFHTVAIHLGMVLVGRLLGGLGIGILYQVTPLYIAEISPEHMRGKLLSLLNLYGAAGFFMGTVMNAIVKDVVFGWRISVSIKFIVATLLATVGTIILPRSPRFLVKKQQEGQALKVLNRIYRSEEKASSQVSEIRSTMVKKGEAEPFKETLKYVMRWNILQRVLIAFFIIFTGRLAGSTFSTYFSVKVFCSIGLQGFVIVIAIAIIAIVSMVSSFAIIDRFGRKPLFMVSLLVMCAAQILSAALIRGYGLEDELEDFSVSQKVAAYFVVASTGLLVAGAVVSVGSIPFMIIGEIFPLKAKGVVSGICTSGFWIGNILVGEVSPLLINSTLKVSGTLILFALGSFILFLFILFLLPETKGLNLEKIDDVFSKPWLERANVCYYLRCGLSCAARTRSRRQLLATSQEELTGDLSSSTSSLVEDNDGSLQERPTHLVTANLSQSFLQESDFSEQL